MVMVILPVLGFSFKRIEVKQTETSNVMKAFEFDMWIAVNCCEVHLGKQCIIRKLPDATSD